MCTADHYPGFQFDSRTECYFNSRERERTHHRKKSPHEKARRKRIRALAALKRKSEAVAG